MKRKLVIVSIILIVLTIMAGAVSPAVERWWDDRNMDPGLSAIRHLRELYRVDRFQQVLAETRQLQEDNRCRNYHPQILYIRWLAQRRMPDHEKDVAEAESEFLGLYPDHILAADMHFDDAMRLMAISDYSAAEAKLAMIETKYPDAKVTAKAKEIRSRLSAATTQPTTQPTRHVTLSNKGPS